MEHLAKDNWNYLKIDDKVYTYKCVFNENEYELVLFDLPNCVLYHEKCEKYEIESHMHKLNSAIEAPINKIILHLKNSLLNYESCKFDVIRKKRDSSHENDEMTIVMESKLSEVRFNWKFNLKQLDLKHLKDQIILPLILNCAEYQLREQELTKILQQKDKEIDDYKSQGVKLTRKYLETAKFSQESFHTVIDKVNEFEEHRDNPEHFICTHLAGHVNEACMKKYFKTHEPNVVASNEPKERKDAKLDDEGDDKAKRSLKEKTKSFEADAAKKNAIEQSKLQPKAPSTPKKKKLF